MAHSLFDVVWILICAAFVMLMQGGFMMLESGLVRAKNSINVAIKNIVDFCLCASIFWLFGFALMFGETNHGLLGTSSFVFGETEDPWFSAFFLFQLMFCGTATTIISGAVAERMKFSGYLLVSLVVAGLIYPVIGHWIWGGLADGMRTGWLGNLGFVDFAGSTVVHSVGGWVALAAILVIGPRTGRFDAQEMPIREHNLTISTLGTLLLWFGWLGFNGGSLLGVSEKIPLVMINTILAGALGGLSAMFLSWYISGRPQVVHALNGTLAGCVGITASSNMVGPWKAVIIGSIAGIVCLGAIKLLQRLKIDDAVGAVPVHLAGGIWGTLAVALFGDPAAWGSGLDRINQFSVQVTGICVAFSWAFGLSFLVFSVLNRIFSLRVSAEGERLGLNVTEHGASTEALDMLNQMEQHRIGNRQSPTILIDPHSDIGQIGAQYNRVIEQINVETERTRLVNNRLTETTKALEERNKELIYTRDQAIRATKVKSEFLATMSHEIRTPLNTVIGMAELLQQSGLTSEQRRHYANSVSRSADTLLATINDVLDLSRIEAGKVNLEQIPCDLRKVVEETIGIFEIRCKDKGLLLESRIDPLISRDLLGDPNRFQQIILNLIGNAVKFTDQGKIVVQVIQKELNERFSTIETSIRDTGCGIKPGQIEKIFERFTQADSSTTRKHGGTGLGLSICRQLVELMGGQISVDSIDGQGSTFKVTLNFEISHHEELVSGESSVSARQELPDNLQILLVDDSLENLELFQAFLKTTSCQVDFAENGLAGVEKAKQGKYNLVFMDIEMPIMDGYTAVQAIRRWEKQNNCNPTPIIAFTAYALDEEVQKCFQVGCTAYLAKPIKKAKLFEAIVRHAEKEVL